MNRDIRLLTISYALWGVGEGLFLTLQPLYIEALGANPAQIGGVLSTLSLAAGLTLIPSGLLSDRLPRKPLMVSSWVCGLTGVLICILARTWRGFIPGLVIYGFSAFGSPICSAYLATASGEDSLERVLSTVTAAYAAGTVLSPALAGYLAGMVGMRAVYLVAFGMFALSAAAVVSLSPQQSSGRAGRPMEWRVLLGTRWVRFVSGIAWSGFAMYLVFPLSANYLTHVRLLNTAQVGMLSSLGALGAMALTLLLGRVGAGKRRMAWLLGQSLVWVSSALLLWAPGVAGAALAYLLRGGYLAIGPLVQANAGRFLGEANRGLALGLMLTVASGAQVLAAVVAGWLFGVQPMWPFLAALAAIPVGVWLTARVE